MNTLFISDLHLSDHAPALVKQFVRFIEEETHDTSALYILGDLFEVWVGDDDASQTADTVARTLKQLSDRGCTIYYMAGNRDFLLGPAYAKRCGMSILSDPTVITLDKTRVLLSHGDVLCTDDQEYQRYRKLTNKKWVQRLFLLLPRCLRKEIANELRKSSISAGKRKTSYVMDVNEQAVNQALKDHECTVLIHGHTHKPAVHQHNQGTRYVLGAWDMQAQILKLEGSVFALQRS